jgi:hypothetical protein
MAFPTHEDFAMFRRPFAVAVVLFAAGVAPADTISILNTPGGLYSTGVPGSVYTYQHIDGSVAVDTKAKLPGGNALPTAGTAVAGTPGLFPLNYYTNGNAAGSQWVLTRSNAGVSGDFSDRDGQFLFSTTFTAPVGTTGGLISGLVAADNRIDKILLNGQDTGFNGGPDSFPANGFPFSPFSVNGGFQEGLNTLSFLLWNEPQATGNPVALNVNLHQASLTVSRPQQSGDPEPIPEPATLAVVGLLAVGGLAARRRRAA